MKKIFYIQENFVNIDYYFLNFKPLNMLQLNNVKRSETISSRAYRKPEIVAENKAEGTFAAACPEESSHICRSCELPM